MAQPVSPRSSIPATQHEPARSLTPTTRLTSEESSIRSISPEIGNKGILDRVLSFLGSLWKFIKDCIWGKAKNEPKIWTTQNLIDIAKETRERIDRGYYPAIIHETEILFQNTVSIPFVPRDPVRPKYPTTEVFVVKQDTLDAAKEELKNGKVAVFNFGRTESPGDGLFEGKNTQEEEICYRSEMLNLMLRFDQELMKELSEQTPHRYYPIYDKILFTPNVMVFRASQAESYKFLDDPYKVGIFSSAAPHRPEITTVEGGKIDYAHSEDRKKVAIAIINQLYAAYEHGFEIVILGAFGCGSFKNPPDAVAELYKKVIDSHFKGAFKKIVFAILEGQHSGESHNPRGNIAPFLEQFSNYKE